MIISITPNTEGQPIKEYRVVVIGGVVMGVSVVWNIFASITDVIGGPSGAYETELVDERRVAM